MGPGPRSWWGRPRGCPSLQGAVPSLLILLPGPSSFRTRDTARRGGGEDSKAVGLSPGPASVSPFL